VHLEPAQPMICVAEHLDKTACPNNTVAFANTIELAGHYQMWRNFTDMNVSYAAISLRKT